MKRINKILNSCKSGAGFTSIVDAAERQWHRYLSTPLPRQQEIDNSEAVFNSILEARDVLVNVPVDINQNQKWGTVSDNKSAHKLYWILSSIAYRFSSNEHGCTPEELSMATALRQNWFAPLTDDQRDILYGCFNKIFRLLDSYLEDRGTSYRHPPATVRDDYMACPMDKIWPNMHFYPCVPDELLSEMAGVFKESGTSRILHAYYGSNFCVSNIRIWKYRGQETEKVGGGQVGAHRDNIPPANIKMMYYDGDITPQHGCFEVLQGNAKRHKVIHQVVGKNPALLVDATNAFHRALSPADGRVRNSMELTIQPYLFPNKELYAECGCCASAPINPFAHERWTKRTYNPDSLMMEMCA